MMPTLTGVDVPNEFLAYMSRDALQSDTAGATPVQITVFDAVSYSLTHNSFSLQFLLRKFSTNEESLEQEDPIHSLLPRQCQDNTVA
jgi:hypothetical protein